MAGTLTSGTVVTTTLSDGTSSITTANAIRGVPKAWVLFVGSTPPAIRASFNVSSVTRNSTGNYIVNFTSALPDNNYAAVFGGGAGSANVDVVVQEAYGTSALRSTTQLGVFSVNASFIFYDAAYVSVAILD
jgi:hypothetical protein